MDYLTIFPEDNIEVKLESKENNSLDTLMDVLGAVQKELRLTRAGHEAWTWGEEVEDSDDLDLEEITESLEGD